MTYKLEYIDLKSKLVYKIQELALENGCNIDSTQWRSKHNKYVIHEKEPYLPESYIVTIVISSSSQERLEFVDYLFENFLKDIGYLEGCLELEI